MLCGGQVQCALVSQFPSLDHKYEIMGIYHKTFLLGLLLVRRGAWLRGVRGRVRNIALECKECNFHISSTSNYNS